MLTWSCGSASQGTLDASTASSTDALTQQDSSNKTCDGQPADLANPATGCADITSCAACILPANATATTCAADGACSFECPADTMKTSTSCLTLPVATKISAGNAFSCAVTATKGVQCWGYNGFGNLGNGSLRNSHVATNVLNLSNVRTISLGESHACAATYNGAVKCWGYNAYNNLGSPHLGNSIEPVSVTNLDSGVVALAAGGHHTCALTIAGAVKCWGNNAHGELGTAQRMTDASVPVDVEGLSSGVVAITAGTNHSCAVLATGAVKCWGDNAYGELGNNSLVSSPIPVEVSNVSEATGVVAGYAHSCALLTSGAVKCWGEDKWGQLGTGAAEHNSAVPVDVAGLAGVTQLSAGALHNLAIMPNHVVRGWGNATSRQLGNTFGQVRSPIVVRGYEIGVVAIAGGATHTCAIADTGEFLCVGDNQSGQLGNNSIVDSAIPVQVQRP